MARLGRRQPQQSRLGKPAAIGPAVVFRALKVWLAQPYLPGHYVTDRAAHSKLRSPAANGPPVVFRALRVVLSGLQLPLQVVTGRGTSYRLQAPSVVSTPPPPFVASPVYVRSVAVFATQAAASQRRAPVSKLNAPAVVATSVTFGPLKVTTVDQPRRYQHAVYKLQQPAAIGAAAVQFMPDPIRAKLTRRPPNYIRVKPQLRPPTVVDPQIVTTLPYPVRVKLVPQPAGVRHAKSVLRPPRAVAPSVTFLPLDITFMQAVTYRRRVPRYRLMPPTVVDVTAVVITTGFFDTPTPSAATFGGALSANLFGGVPDSSGLDGDPAANSFRAPRPRRT